MHFSTRDKTETADKPAPESEAAHNTNEPCAGLHDSSLPSSVCLQVYILVLLCCWMSCRWAASFQLSTPLWVTSNFTKYNGASLGTCIWDPTYQGKYDGASSAALVMIIALIWLICEKLASRSLLLWLWMSAELGQTPRVLSQRIPETAVILILVSALVCTLCGVTRRNCPSPPSSLFVVCCYG
jgi:hypothetical protein